MMLDAKTLQWLENRDALQFMFDQYTLPDGEVSFDDDFSDAAEFEARVAEKLAMGNVCHNCALPRERDCPLKHWPYSTYRKPATREEVAACRMKKVRLAVEQEMIAEGKGPGRTEEAE